MRISDWSSDVCSSDLSATGLLVDLPTAQNGRSITAYAARKRGSGKVGLTPRQTEVLRLVAKGKSNKEVGRDLGMLEGTVKAHLRAVMQKLRVTNRTALAMRAARMGLVSDNHAPYRARPVANQIGRRSGKGRVGPNV